MATGKELLLEVQYCHLVCWSVDQSGHTVTHWHILPNDYIVFQQWEDSVGGEGESREPDEQGDTL